MEKHNKSFQMFNPAALDTKIEVGEMVEGRFGSEKKELKFVLQKTFFAFSMRNLAQIYSTDDKKTSSNASEYQHTPEENGIKEKTKFQSQNKKKIEEILIQISNESHELLQN